MSNKEERHLDKKRRVVVTGMGVTSCFGSDVDRFYQALLEGRSGMGRITAFDASPFPTQIAAEIKEFDVGDYMDKKLSRRADPYIRYTMVAGKKALEKASLFSPESLAKLDKKRCGALISSGMGGMNTYEEGVTTYLERGYKRISPFFVPFIITNMAGALLAMDVGFMGPNYSISTACATSSHSIALAAKHIQWGDADVMLAGGVEAAIVSVGLGGFCACKALSTRNDEPEKASRPWDIDRDGFVMGEGAGILVLESLEHALARGAPILAEYLGGAVTCDAHHITEPHPEGEGVFLAVQNALQDAKLSPEQIHYINAHATSTPLGDMAEIRALERVFTKPENIVINATKSMIGHCLGAAGGIEAIATIKALEEQEVHPTINLEQIEKDFPFKAPRTRENVAIEAALSNSFGFGGHNASLIFGTYRG